MMSQITRQKGPNGLTEAFYGWLEVYSYLKEHAFTQLKGMQSFKQTCVEGVPFVSKRCEKGIPGFRRTHFNIKQFQLSSFSSDVSNDPGGSRLGSALFSTKMLLSRSAD